jgi:heme-degrading monooxygenase HmoA
MAIRVIIEWKTSPGTEPLLSELLRENRARLLGIKGYISGETLRCLDDPSTLIVVSTWRTLADWEAWVTSEERKEMQDKIESLLGAPSVHRVYICGQ